MAFEAFIAWLPVAERESGVKLKSFHTDPHLHEPADFPNAHSGDYTWTSNEITTRGRFIHSKETVAARDVIFYERLTLPTYLANLEEDRDPTGGFRGDRHFVSAADEADWDEQNVDNASEEAGPLPYFSVPIPMDDENPRDSVNAKIYFEFADTGYVTPAELNTDEAERIGPNFIPDPETEDRDPTGGFRGDRHFVSAADEADWDEQNVDNASEEAGPLPYFSVPIPMDDENPRDSVNAKIYFEFADTGYITPAELNTDEAERIGPNFIPDPETGDEAVYPADTTLPRYTQSGLQILGLVTAVHGTETHKEPATV
ncbi:unnamed protein product [Closterium sp. NIES-53]